MAAKQELKLPKEIIYRKHQYDHCGTKLEHIKSDSMGHYYAKCEGSSSMIHYVSALYQQDILEGKHQSFYVSYEALEKAVLMAAQRLVSNIMETTTA